MFEVKYCDLNNTTNEQDCQYICDANCFASISLSFVFLIWFCYMCKLCVRGANKKNILYVTGLNSDQEVLLDSDELVVVGTNIEKPPEYNE